MMRAKDQEAKAMSVEITRTEKRWHWRTWNLLLQIREATDGEDSRQRSGDMTERNLLIAAGTSEMKALRSRKWVKCVAFGEEPDTLRELPAWAITKAGRKALDAAVRAGLTIQ